tara:strand:- start:38 stop:448 length:411 start_codon:yes stop_codon:yes gene_type:complete
MGVLSKFSPTNWKSGGYDVGDFHIWVENPYGEVIDPYFPQHQEICNDRGLDINKRRYQEWDNQEYYLNKHMRQTDFRENWDDKAQKGYTKYYPKWARCPLNAMYNYYKDPNYYRIVVGSMGWGKKGRSNIVWYEFG